MLRSILIGLDGSDDSKPALELGLHWAKSYEALAIGIAVVDEPDILVSGEVLLESGYHQSFAEPLVAEAHHKAVQTLREFAKRCDEAGVQCHVIDGEGIPHFHILQEAQRYDLILLGRLTHFDYGWKDDSDDTVARVVRDSPRPVVAVPCTPPLGAPVVVAYDGSLQSARALYAFEASGLGRDRPVEVVSVAADRTLAHRIADRAVEFLRLHEIEAQAHAILSKHKPAGLILERVQESGAGLLVMGAYGQPVVREFFLGSVTRSILESSRVPIFCYH